MRRPSIYFSPAVPPRSLKTGVTSWKTEYTLYLAALASAPLAVSEVLCPLIKLKYSLRQSASAHAHTRSKNPLLVHHACHFGGRRSAVVGSLLLRTGFLQLRRISLAGRTCMHSVHCDDGLAFTEDLQRTYMNRGKALPSPRWRPGGAIRREVWSNLYH